MKQHLVFQVIEQGDRYAAILEKIFLYVEGDPNHGLPEELFERNDFVVFELDSKNGKIEWWPPCGPAPHWSAIYADFATHHDMFEAWDKWARVTY